MGVTASAPTNASTRYATPLRYPGGKGRLAPFIESLMEANGLVDGHYVEPYAGGAAIAIRLLIDQFASIAHINDVDRAVYAFWHSVLNSTDALTELIDRTPVTMKTWRKQREIYADRHERDLLRLGFATFFLNRTNRSGIIIRGGAIGGTRQTGTWKLDARFNKRDLITRIQRIARYRDRIKVSNLDAEDFLRDRVRRLPKRTLVYADPPYYHKGDRLYANFYEADDHRRVAAMMMSLPMPWLVSYDNLQETRALYRGLRQVTYNLSYSAANYRRGSEVLVFADSVRLPPGLLGKHLADGASRGFEVVVRRASRSRVAQVAP